MAVSRLPEGVDVVRAKGLERERVRVVGGAHGGSHRADEERKAEEGRLSEREKSELLFYWSGHAGVLGCRSVQGAVEDRLLRGPPSVGRVFEDAIEQELVKRGPGGWPRESLVEVLAAEVVVDGGGKRRRGVGGTRREARLAIWGMAGAGRVEFFVAERKKHVEGREEVVPTEMVRIVPERMKRAFPDRVSPEERWARADAELEAYCQRIEVHEAPNGAGSSIPEGYGAGRAGDAVRRRLARLSRRHRRVLERAYDPLAHWSGRTAQLFSEWAALGEDVARVAVLTGAVEEARRELVRERAATPEARKTLDRSTLAVDAVAWRLDQAPDGEAERKRWRGERLLFVERVRAEAVALLREVVEAYRAA